MIRRTGLLLLALSLTACASPLTVKDYDTIDRDRTQVDKDGAACELEAMKHADPREPGQRDMLNIAYDACMRSKGYRKNS